MKIVNGYAIVQIGQIDGEPVYGDYTDCGTPMSAAITWQGIGAWVSTDRAVGIDLGTRGEMTLAEYGQLREIVTADVIGRFRPFAERWAQSPRGVRTENDEG